MRKQTTSEYSSKVPGVNFLFIFERVLTAMAYGLIESIISWHTNSVIAFTAFNYISNTKIFFST